MIDPIKEKAEKIADELINNVISADRYLVLRDDEIYRMALIAVDHILEMLNVHPTIHCVETYRHKLYTEVKQILEK